MFPWWASLLFGALLGGPLGAVLDWLFRRGDASKVKLLEVQVADLRKRGDDNRDAAQVAERARQAAEDRRIQNCADLEERLRASENQRHTSINDIAGVNARLRAEIKLLEADLADIDTIPAARARARRLLQSGDVPGVPTPDTPAPAAGPSGGGAAGAVLAGSAAGAPVGGDPRDRLP